MSRPQAEIKWDEVDDLLMAGCSGVEISGYFGIIPNTLYDRCEKDKGILFSKYSQDKRAKGQSFLRAHQYAKALGKTDKGDNSLLIWLGKQRLDQRDKPKEEEVEDDLVRKLAQAIKDIEGLSGSEKTGGSEVAAE